MFGRLLFSGIIILIYTAFLLIFNLNPWSYILLIGALLMINFLPFGPIGHLLGIVLCGVGGAVLWGIGGFLLAGGLAVNLWGDEMRGRGDPFSRTGISFKPWFPFIGYASYVAIIAGVIILLINFILRIF